MRRLSKLTNIWETVKEFELAPIRQEALEGVKLVVSGSLGSGRRILAEQLVLDPSRPEVQMESFITILDLDDIEQENELDLVILMIDSRQSEFSQEAKYSRKWAQSGIPVLVIINQYNSSYIENGHQSWIDWQTRRVVIGSILDRSFLEQEVALAVIDLLPNKLMALGRRFPIFRIPIAHYLINETCYTNAAYSLSTGLAEIIPVLTIPLTITDMIVLSKNQAFLVYKLGLTLGFSTRWQDYIAEFGGVLGSGFMWRQVARSLIGLVPLWGIIPKVGVAYAGTFVVGNVVLQWYITGRHISKKQMQELYYRSLHQGKETARRILSRMPKIRFPRLKLPRLKLRRLQRPSLRLPRLPSVSSRKKRQAKAMVASQECPECGRLSAEDAVLCQYCGFTY